MKDTNFDIFREIPSTEFTNIATVEAHGYYSSAEAKFKVCNYADLSVTKTTTTPIGYVCENLIYIITVVNNGPSKATDVILTDVLPCHCICASITLTQGTYTCSNGKINCYLGDLNCNANAIAVVVVVPKRPCILTNRTFVTANEEDPNYNNNFFTKKTRVYCRCSKSHEQIPFILTLLLLHNNPYC